MPSTRRATLASLGAATAALAGCTTLEDLLRDPPDRRVTPDWSPAPGTWPESGYGPANTRYNPHATPPREPPTAAWTEVTRGNVTSLVVGDRRVYAGTDEEVVALDPADGTRMWTREADGTSELAYTDGRLYERDTERVRARSADGEKQWETSVPELPLDVHEQDGYVLLPTGGGSLTLHADTGEVVRDRDSETGRIAVRPDGLYGADYGTVGRYRLRNRGLANRWTSDIPGPYQAYAPPVVVGDVLYQSERALSGSDAPGGRLSMYGVDDGARQGGQPFDHVPFGVAVGENRVFVGTATITAGDLGVAGRFVALDRSGSRRWEYRVGGGIAPPAVGGDVVVAGPYARSTTPVTALDADSGRTLWERTVPGSAELVAVEDTVYVGAAGSVTALRP